MPEAAERPLVTNTTPLIALTAATAEERARLLAQAARESAATDELITHTTEEIALLEELRAATIADAVLGRVDVRTAA